MSLVAQLGFPHEARLLIITCDNLGAYHAANIACYEAIRTGIATTGSLMVPAPWAQEAVRGYRGSDVGVHLTLNAEFECYRWGSITNAPTLQSGEGGFPRTVDDLWEHADVDEVRRECRAQIERAIVWGFDPTHIDSHLDSLTLRPELFDICLDLALEYRLPVRLPDAVGEQRAGFPMRALAAEAGVLTPDRSLTITGPDRLHHFDRLVASLEPGVNAISLQPAIDTPELRAITDDADHRVDDHQLLVAEGAEGKIRELGVELISWADLRTAQRSGVA